ncbi:hypothetical protein MW290_12915 [Aquincola tertiaricarbonis]|uniref:Uncharacterized protein n=1 Tax=Aquincola tertiaricarbonis TaxID=391953 RepID=A0ABY4S6F0_AQUTE|nr:hypothetical protein [Aquincola tertiaricarbonis]URI06794.1 hypothetical protein MW290_12915 [Aquincola tertiaricarbonis]
MFGVLIALGLIDELVAALSGTADKPRDPALFLVLAPIGAFCLEMGARLVLARRNRHGSLMSPMSWRVLGSVFAAFCFGIAHHLERREPR